MKSLQKNKSVILALIILVFVIVAYNALFKNTLSIESEGAEARNIGGDLVALFKSLEGVTLDQRLFSTTIYKSLVDFSTEIPALPVGRSNPFDVIGR